MSDPSYINLNDKRGLENTAEVKTPWSGPSAEVMLGLALQQPGARQRRHGVKFQCAGCRDEGHDKSKDNACVFLDGRFSCAVGGNAHRKAIAQQLNIPHTPPARVAKATVQDELAQKIARAKAAQQTELTLEQMIARANAGPRPLTLEEKIARANELEAKRNKRRSKA